MPLTPENRSTAVFERNIGLAFLAAGAVMIAIGALCTDMYSDVRESVSAKWQGLEAPELHQTKVEKIGHLVAFFGTVPTLMGLFSVVRGQVWIWTGNNKAVERHQENLRLDM